MAYNFQFAVRLARLRTLLCAAMILAFAGCDASKSVSPESDTPTELGLETDAGVETAAGVETVALAEPSFASTSFAGGIPLGTSSQPLTAFGTPYNGAKMTIAPGELLKYLAAIRARGGKVVLMFAGNHRFYTDSRGFNLTKWKARVDRYKGINFSSYITNGTIIGHYLIDEPNDASNWGGRAIPPSTVDEMARYSKQRWAGMTTIARVEPGYFRTPPRYLDAAWAAYVTRKGNVSDFIRRNVAEAQRARLALVVGLNVSKGGPNQRRMSPTEVKNFGSTLLSSSYPCAFISWQYDSYVASATMRDAMRVLRGKAQSRASKSCRS
jgi:hypothetical protein